MHPRKRRGNILLLAAASSVMLLGSAATAVDMAQAYTARSRQQAAVDAGAIAAVYHLAPPADLPAARQAAIHWVAQNGYSIAPTDVTFFNHPSGEKGVTVRCQKAVDTAFARIFGLNQIQVGAAAAATVAPVASMPTGWLPLSVPAYRSGDLGPWAIAPGTDPDAWFVKSTPDGGYQLLTADPAKGGPTRLVLKEAMGSSGNYQALAIGGSGANTYRDNLAHGSDVPLTLPTTLPTKPGKMSGPTAQGLALRLATQGEAGRMILVPLTRRSDWEAANGRTQIEIIGYLSARLDAVDVVTGQVSATFISRVLPTRVNRHGPAAGAGLYAPLLVPTP